ncbi:hypothetical protein E2I00_003811, partial [Balaenoptera physalus]
VICGGALCLISSCQPGSWTTAQSPVVSQPAANQPNAGPATVKSLDSFPLTAMFLDLQKLTLLLLLPVCPVQATHQPTPDAQIAQVRPDLLTPLCLTTMGAPETTALTSLGIPAIFLLPHAVLSAPLSNTLHDNCHEPWGKPMTCLPTSCESSACSPPGCSPIVSDVSRSHQETSFFPITAHVSNSCQPASCRQPLSCHLLSYQSFGSQPLSYPTYGLQPLTYLTYGRQPRNYLSYDCQPLRYLPYRCQPLRYMPVYYRPINYT